MNITQQWGPVAVIVGGYLLGIYFQNRGLDAIHKRIDDLSVSLNKRIDDLGKRIDDLALRIARLEGKFDRWEETILKQQADHEIRIFKLENPGARSE